MEERTPEPADVAQELAAIFGPEVLSSQQTRDPFPTLWVRQDKVRDVLAHLKNHSPGRYPMLYDLTAIDERRRAHRPGQPESRFTVIYQLLSLETSRFLRLKVALQGDDPVLPSVTSLWPAADWYEREVFDMFGVRFTGHPNLRRILMPAHWKGHPLRKEHPARATELEPFSLSEEQAEVLQQEQAFRPEEWGMKPGAGSSDGEEGEFLFLNLGPQHPGTHGVLRAIVKLDGEEIVDAVMDIGYHHRGAEKMGERQTWHTFIPYTDRIDYLGGVMNNFPYVMAVERLAGIEVPPRAQVIRVMMAELFRIASHLVWYGTFAQDVGALSPVFFMFNDRERIFDIVQAICGGRMHPSWFRIGGVAQDLPKGWKQLILNFLDHLPGRLAEYDQLVMKNRIFQARTRGIGRYTLAQALDWGVTGPGLRACGLAWDARKKMPYSGYDQLEFEVPTAQDGDCYARAVVRVEEMRQSLRIIRQCLANMPDGPIRSAHPLATPPDRPRTLQDIETLIHHFLSTSWGPVIPAGEAFAGVEATKGHNGYYLVSDGGTMSYRTRIRAPSFPHIQMVPAISRGLMIPDLLAILGSVDFVLADVDR